MRSFEKDARPSAVDLQRVDHREELPLSLRVGKERGHEALARGRALLDGREDPVERGGRRPRARRGRCRRSSRRVRRRPTRPLPWRTSFIRPFRLSSVWRSERERAWPFSDSEVISPRKPSPFSVRPRMFLSDFEIATTLSTRSPEPARIFSSSAPRNAMISWSGSRSGLSVRAGRHLEVLVAEEADRLDLGAAVRLDEVLVLALDVEVDREVLARHAGHVDVRARRPRSRPRGAPGFRPRCPASSGSGRSTTCGARRTPSCLR